MKNGKMGLRFFIYATYNSESICSFPRIQLIFAKLSLTEALMFNTVGADRKKRERKITWQDKEQKVVSVCQKRSVFKKKKDSLFQRGSRTVFCMWPA